MNALPSGDMHGCEGLSYTLPYSSIHESNLFFIQSGASRVSLCRIFIGGSLFVRRLSQLDQLNSAIAVSMLILNSSE